MIVNVDLEVSVKKTARHQQSQQQKKDYCREFSVLVWQSQSSGSQKRFGVQTGQKYPVFQQMVTFLSGGSLLANLCFSSHLASLVPFCVLQDTALGLSCQGHPSLAPGGWQTAVSDTEMHLTFAFRFAIGWMKAAISISHTWQSLREVLKP